MLRRSLVAGVLLGTLLLSASALAGNVPRAELVQKADAVCTAMKASVHVKGTPPTDAMALHPTPRLLKTSATYYANVSAAEQLLATRVFALGTPSEPAARAAWIDWKKSVTGTLLPTMRSIAAATKAGNVAALAKTLRPFALVASKEAKDRKLLGLKVCAFLS